LSDADRCVPLFSDFNDLANFVPKLNEHYDLHQFKTAFDAAQESTEDALIGLQFKYPVFNDFLRAHYETEDHPETNELVIEGGYARTDNKAKVE